MLRIFETQFIGNFAYGFVNIKNAFFGNSNYFRLYVFLSRPAGFLFN